MPRRQFIADLQKAQNDVLPPGIHDLQQGEDDGQFEFLFAGTSLDQQDVKITALVPDLGQYPGSHEYMIFTGEEASADVADAVENIRRTNSKTVFELLDIVSATLLRLSTDNDGDTNMPDSQHEDDLSENDDDDDDVYDSDHEAFQAPTLHTTAFAQPRPGVQVTFTNKAFQDRVRFDLRAAKQAGFKVGVLGHVLDGFNAFVTVSIRISKLGISEEAMQAWQIEGSDYLILILQYLNGYKTHEELQGFDSIRLDANIGMRVCAGKKYKPTLQEAINAFTVVKNNERESYFTTALPKAADETGESSIKETFISKPLNGLLKERMVPILRFRSMGLGWQGAEDLYLSHTSAGASKSDAVDDRYFAPESVNDALQPIVKADDYCHKPSSLCSFPLVSMQFLLRHFVRCTEFCLVCHRKMSTQLEAIKPYVCESDLCLYQYMTLGFGPSIEHEIAAQPYVVDLLVSFCYASALSNRLREFPDGLSLMVPPIDQTLLNASSAYAAPYRGRQPEPEPEAKVRRKPAATYEVGFDCERREILFPSTADPCPVKRGDWIVLRVKGTLQGDELHFRVNDVTYYPTISVGDPVVLQRGKKDKGQAGTTITERTSTPQPVTPATTPIWAPASFQRYCEDFKNLTKREKCFAICKLLDTLPNVKTMQEYVTKRPSADLKNWNERISSSALSLLRWIIASNRACIMQVDGDSDGTSAPRKEERLWGMNNYMQFRFATGAPDKEQRFINEVRNTVTQLDLKHPTLFAWHGSPIYNWHMIIREGLHYKHIDHGRAYGDGVYHALDAMTSTGYAANHGAYGSESWPNSVLQISTALALNEIVNAPDQFKSQSPFYVVAQLDWIQTRYLFVQCAPTLDSIKIGADAKPQNPLQQDPNRIPRGNKGEGIVIPASAIKSSRIVKDERRPDSLRDPTPHKKLKAQGGFDNPIPIDYDDDTSSVSTDTSDLDVMFGDDAETETQLVVASNPEVAKGPATDFIPGSLDFSKLPLMPMPTYATSGTTKRLMKDLQTIAATQGITPLGELGWYIDVEHIENVYQWIVELHSFHTFEIKGRKLPLADDMKKKGIKSVVLEIRFNKDFPFTPPYVRVIRPRFLTLLQGGGGHIVAGGAMCMELLTNTGWSSVSSIESVLMQIRMAIASEPFARLDMRSTGDYGVGEAADGYVRACRTHGWQIPPGFESMAYGGGASSSLLD